MPPEPKFLELLPHLTRPPGGGIYAVSAGKDAAFELQAKIYGRAATGPEAIDKLWRESWAKLAGARVVILGVPLDTGAGIKRGAAYGPRGVREALLELAEYRQLIKSSAVLDLGDVLVNPHLLHDEMLSATQIRASQEAMYATAASALRTKFAVSALSQLSQLLKALWAEHPKTRLFVIGGDHSVAWPVVESLAPLHPGTLGIVQPDAHTDLLPSRLGVKYCFGTWSFHANELIGRGGRLVQLGIRQSGKDKKHWESTTGVRQFWPDELGSDEKFVEKVVAHLKAIGVQQLYFSNDIDGTDEAEAIATGTPAPGGLSSKQVLKVIERLGEEFELIAADIMEVAPVLGDAESGRKTCTLAARYALQSLKAQLRSN